MHILSVGRPQTGERVAVTVATGAHVTTIRGIWDDYGKKGGRSEAIGHVVADSDNRVTWIYRDRLETGIPFGDSMLYSMATVSADSVVVVPLDR